MGNIAICITTRNRPMAFKKTFGQWKMLKPKNAAIFVVDDASEEPYCKATYRFEQRAGIPKAKNKCLELAMDWGADHIFLADDDCYPIKKQWEQLYIHSNAHHLSFTFTSPYQYVSERRPPRLVEGFKIHELPSGCMLYFTRACIERVGGFDENYGLGLYEHVDISRRVFNAGMTKWKFMDVEGSENYFHSMDEHKEIERSFSLHERNSLMQKNIHQFKANDRSSAFVNYK